MKTAIRVINKYKDASSILTHRVYIGRPTALGNPYKVMSEADRGPNIQKFEDHLRYRMRTVNPTSTAMHDLLNAASEGWNIDLECSCSPKPCHGDVIKKVLEEMIKEKENAPN